MGTSYDDRNILIEFNEISVNESNTDIVFDETNKIVYLSSNKYSIDIKVQEKRLRDLVYYRVPFKYIEDPKENEIFISKGKFGINTITYRIWYESFGGKTNYLEISLLSCDLDENYPNVIEVNLNNRDNYFDISKIIITRKINDSANWYKVEEIKIEKHVLTFFDKKSYIFTINDYFSENIQIDELEFPTKNSTLFNYDMLFFVPGKTVQSAELNDIQLLWKQYQENLGKSIFEEGDIVEGCNIFIDSNGNVEISNGKIFLNGRIREIDGIGKQFYTNSKSTSSFLVSGAGSTKENILFKTIYTSEEKYEITIPDDEEHVIGVKFDSYTIISPDDDPALRDPAKDHWNYNKSGAFAVGYKVKWTIDDDSSRPIFYIKNKKLQRTVNDYAIKYSKILKTLSKRTKEESNDYLIQENGFEKLDSIEYKTESPSICANIGASNTGKVLYDDPIPKYDVEYFNFKINPFIVMLDGNRVEYLQPGVIKINKGRNTKHVNAERHVSDYSNFIYKVNSENPITNLTDVVIQQETTKDVLKGVAGGKDLIPDSDTLIEVEQVSWFDGSTTHYYQKNVDYVVDGQYIDWIMNPPGGPSAHPEPHTGEHYQVKFKYSHTMEIGQRQLYRKCVIMNRSSESYDILPDRDIISIETISKIVSAGNEIYEVPFNKNDYELDDGQRWNSIIHGRIEWKMNSSDPLYLQPGEQYKVIYYYWNHDVEGEYVSVNSYSHRDFIKSFNGKDLKYCIDFRTDSSTFPLSGTNFYLDYDMYLYRKDVVAIDKSNENYPFIVFEGDPSELKEDAFHQIIDKKRFFPLYKILVHPYTNNIEDEVEIEKYFIPVYEMNKIEKLDDRLTKVEEFVMLSNLEQEALYHEIDGQNKGLLCDDFIDITKADTGYRLGNENEQCDFAIDLLDTACVLPYKTKQVDFTIEEDKTSCWYNNVQALLHFEEIEIYSQILATNDISVQPYSVVPKKNAFINLYPSFDSYAVKSEKKTVSVSYNPQVQEGIELGYIWNEFKLKSEGLDLLGGYTLDEIKRMQNMVSEGKESVQDYGLYSASIQRSDAIKVTTGKTSFLKVTTDDRVSSIQINDTFRNIPIRFTIENLDPSKEYQIVFDDEVVNVYAFDTPFNNTGIIKTNEIDQFLSTKEKNILKILKEKEDYYTDIKFVTNTIFKPNKQGKFCGMFILPRKSLGLYKVIVRSYEDEEEYGFASFSASSIILNQANTSIKFGVPTFNFEEQKDLTSEVVYKEQRAIPPIPLDKDITITCKSNLSFANNTGVTASYEYEVASRIVNDALFKRIILTITDDRGRELFKEETSEPKGTFSINLSVNQARFVVGKVRVENQISGFEKTCRTDLTQYIPPPPPSPPSRPRRARSNWGFGDPVGQSFNLKHKYGNGCFINKIGIFAKNKPERPVIIEVGTLNNKGYPDNTIVLAKGIVYPNEVKFSEDATQETIINLDRIVYISPNKNYWFKIYSEDINFHVFYAEIGKADLKTGNILMKNAEQSGAMFDSPNQKTWKVNGKRDLTYKLYGLKFPLTEEGIKEETLVLNANEIGEIIDFNFGKLLPLSTELNFYYSVDNGQNWIPVKSSDTASIPEAISNISNVCLFKIDFKTTDEYVSPIIFFDKTLIRFLEYKLKGRYVSKTIETVEAFNSIELIFENKLNKFSEVIPYASFDDGETWSEMDLLDHYEIKTKGTFEYKYKLTKNNVTFTKGKIKLEMSTTNNKYSPKIKKLRIFCAEK